MVNPFIALTALCTLAGRFGARYPYAELATHPRLQYTYLSGLGLAWAIARGKPLDAGISALCLVINGSEVLDGYRQPVPRRGQNHFRTLHLNVLAGNPQVQSILDLVRHENPDLAVFQEVDQSWVDRLRTLGYGYALENPGPSQTGIAVYSRFPLSNTAIRVFASPQTPALIMDVCLPGGIVHLIATHPLAPQWGIQARQGEFAALGDYVATVTGPLVLIGDLNSTVWSPYFKDLLQRSKLHDSRQGFGVLPTWPVLPVLNAIVPGLGIPLDHCLVSQEIQVLNLRTGPAVGSDHLPLIADLSFG